MSAYPARSRFCRANAYVRGSISMDVTWPPSHHFTRDGDAVAGAGANLEVPVAESSPSGS